MSALVRYTQVIQERPDPRIALIVHKRWNHVGGHVWRWGFVVRVGRLAFKVDAEKNLGWWTTWKPGIVRG